MKTARSGSSSLKMKSMPSSAAHAVMLRFIDNGKAYDPTEQKEPDITLSADEREIGGLGIFMVKKFMDKVEYTRHENKNVLTLTKYR
ncbi:MAG: ATP-binding protein [Clostridia bacterium]|nr:ATP-binding protein [Clostridia bacterium]